jgi:hypothetical protein
MRNYIILGLVFFGINTSISQITDLEIVTKQNDTIKNVELKNVSTFTKISLTMSLQDKLVFKDSSGNKKELLPKDVQYFKLNYENEKYKFENVDDKGFALIMYEGKLKLLRYIKPGYTTVRIYIVKKPGNGKTLYMEAMGLGRLISKKVITREITDCPSLIEKVENKILKISGEEGVIELIKDYETSCFN